VFEGKDELIWKLLKDGGFFVRTVDRLATNLGVRREQKTKQISIRVEKI